MIHKLLCNLYDKFSKSSFYNAIQWFAHGDLESRIVQANQFLLQVAFQHQRVFPQYRNCNQGKDFVVVACGPSVANYEPIQNAVHASINRAIKFGKIKFDYLFLSEAGKLVTKEEMLQFNAYRPDSCVKFYGTVSNRRPVNAIVSESDVLSANAHRFYIDEPLSGLRFYKREFPFDISTQPFIIPGSTVFVALQFALWTNPRRLFLVGCDCTHSGHFYSAKENSELETDLMKNSYTKFKKFASTYYPETEIISVNPVGLKGLFRDWYQKDGPLN